jgi:4-hydroxy-4-methyl-2-oxoglutarate aldolase
VTAAVGLHGSDEWLDLGSSTVSEATGGIECALDPGIQAMWPGARVCGPAYAVCCEPGTNLPIHAALELAPDGAVLVVDAGGDLAGYWGEVLTRAAVHRGLAGLVIDGGIRDVDAIRECGFPVFARGLGIRGTGKSPSGSFGGSAFVSGVPVHTGDLVVADSDGVVVVPIRAVGRTLVGARERQQRERMYFDRIARGESTVDIYGWREQVDQW